MKTKHIFLAAFISLCGIGLQSNAQRYTFNSATDAYNHLADPVNISPEQAWDNFYQAIPLGFEMEIMGIKSDTLYVNSFGIYTKKWMNSNEGFAAIIPFVAGTTGFADRAYLSGSSTQPIAQSRVGYLFTGEIGQRVLKIEYRNVKFKNSISNTDAINLTIALYEADNKIEFRYGDIILKTSKRELFGEKESPVIQLARINANEQVEELIALSGNAKSPAMISSGLPELNTVPAKNTCYTFSSINLGIKNPGTIESLLTLYPNPAENNISLSKETELLKNQPVTIIDMAGRIVLNTSSDAVGKINIQALPAGSYWLSTGDAGNPLVFTKQ